MLIGLIPVAVIRFHSLLNFRDPVIRHYIIIHIVRIGCLQYFESWVFSVLELKLLLCSPPRNQGAFLENVFLLLDQADVFQ